jgi:hypothetical protein
MDTGFTPYEGVTKHDVHRAIDQMSEKEMRRFLKMNFKSVESHHEKDD